MSTHFLNAEIDDVKRSLRFHPSPRLKARLQKLLKERASRTRRELADLKAIGEARQLRQMVSIPNDGRCHVCNKLIRPFKGWERTCLDHRMERGDFDLQHSL